MKHSIATATVGLTAIASCASITIAPPSQPPSTSPIPHSFPGFAVDGIFLPNYAGNKSHPGVYTRNLIESVANKSGAPPHMRVGGTSWDHAEYDASLNETIMHIPEKQQKNGIELNVGPSYFESFSTWPGFKWTWQVPLGFGTLQNSIAMAKQGVKAIGTSNFFALELGNEPSPGSFSTVENYVNQYLNYSAEISAQVSGLPPGPIYQGLVLAASAPPSFSIENLFAHGVDRHKNMKTVSHHFYEVFFGNNVEHTADFLQNTLLNHEHLVETTNYLKSAVDFLNQNHSNLPLILGEIGSGLAGSDDNATQVADIESSLGTAIWTADFHMYMMSIGVAGISNQLGTPWTFTPWTAKISESQGATYPPYYGILFAADALGSDTTKETKVRELKSSDGNITAYGIYQGPTLSKVAICNLDLWSPQVSKGQRPTKQIELHLPDNVKASSARIDKLTGPNTFDRFNTTYGGFSYKFEHHGNGVKVHDDTENVKINGGKVTVNVNATEALLVSFH